MPEDHNYSVTDKYGNFDTIQLEYLKRNKGQKKIGRCKESLKELDSFKERLSNVVKKFDNKWKWPEYLRDVKASTNDGNIGAISPRS